MNPSVPMAKEPRGSQTREANEFDTGSSLVVGIELLEHRIGPFYGVDLSDEESGNGDAAIKSHALGLLNPGRKRSQTAALTVPYVLAGLCAKPAKYSFIKRSLKFVRGYLATICSRTSMGN